MVKQHDILGIPGRNHYRGWMANSGMLDFLKIIVYPNLKLTENANEKRVSGQDIAEGTRGSQENGQTGNRNTERSSGENAPENAGGIIRQIGQIMIFKESFESLTDE